MLSELNSGGVSSFAKNFDRLFNTKSVYDWFVFNSLVMQGDSYVKNYFLIYDPKKSERAWSVVPWDYDMSFGRDGNPLQKYPEQILNDLFSYSYPVLSGPDNVLKSGVLASPALSIEFRKQLNTNLTAQFSEGSFSRRIDQAVRQIESAVYEDTSKWGSQSDFYEQTEALKYYAAVRSNYILTQFINSPVSGLNDEATVLIKPNVKKYDFVDPLGKTIAQLSFKNVGELKKISVRAFPSQVAPGITGANNVKRFIEIVSEPVSAAFNAELKWEFLDGPQLSEVSGGLMSDHGLKNYNFISGSWIELPGKVNRFGNFTTTTISSKNCGKGKFFALQSDFSIPTRWQNADLSHWHRWTSAVKTKDNKIISVGDDGAVLVSENAGKSWTMYFSGTHSQLRSLMATEKSLFAIDQFGQLIKSSNGGKTWNLDILEDKSVQLKFIDYLNDKLAWAISQKGDVISSSDGGRTWSSPKLAQVNVTALKVLDQNHLLAASSDGKLFKSENAGKDWKHTILEFPVKVTKFFTDDTKNIWGMAGEGRVVLSKDAGATWKSITVTAEKIQLRDMVIGPERLYFVVGENGAIFSSENGSNWKSEYPNSSSDLNAIVYMNESNQLVAFGTGGSVLLRK